MQKGEAFPVFLMLLLLGFAVVLVDERWLRTAIAKINRTPRKRFRETFDQVNAKFREFSPRLFRGGQAELRLTDEDLAIIDAAKRKSGMLSRADALRYVLRFWADRTKLDVEALPKSKRLRGGKRTR